VGSWCHKKLWVILQAFLMALCSLLKIRKVLICRLGKRATSRKVWGFRTNEVIEFYPFTLSYWLPSLSRLSRQCGMLNMSQPVSHSWAAESNRHSRVKKKKSLKQRIVELGGSALGMCTSGEYRNYSRKPAVCD
jgi:hypothetical protein